MFCIATINIKPSMTSLFFHNKVNEVFLVVCLACITCIIKHKIVDWIDLNNYDKVIIKMVQPLYHLFNQIKSNHMFGNRSNMS